MLPAGVLCFVYLASIEMRATCDKSGGGRTHLGFWLLRIEKIWQQWARMTTWQRLPRADQLLSSSDTSVLSFATVPTAPYYPALETSGLLSPYLAVLLLDWVQLHIVFMPRKVSELATPGLAVLAQTIFVDSSGVL